MLPHVFIEFLLLIVFGWVWISAGVAPATLHRYEAVYVQNLLPFYDLGDIFPTKPR